MADSEPTERADEVASGSGVDDIALGDPMSVEAMGVNGLGQS